MLAVFSGEMVDPPPELVAAGSRTPSPKTRGSELVTRFLRSSEPAVSLQIGSFAHLAYSHAHQSPFRPREKKIGIFQTWVLISQLETLKLQRGNKWLARNWSVISKYLIMGRNLKNPHISLRLFAAKDDIFCIFEGVLDNLGSLRHHYGLSKGANEAMLLIEAYKTLRDRAPHPTNFMLGHLDGNFSFVIFDKATSTLLVSSDPEGKVPLYWGITSDGCTAFCNDVDLLKGSCGKSLAPFPRGCFYSNKLGGLKSYEKPKNKVTAKLANDEELCGATFQVEESSVAMETC